jgi:hypothetical protein
MEGDKQKKSCDGNLKRYKNHTTLPTAFLNISPSFSSLKNMISITHHPTNKNKIIH